MNPYDFVRIEWDKPPIREKPIWHYQLSGPQQQKLYHGHIELAIQTETPFFIIDPHNNNRPARSLRNLRGQGDYIIPGSSLKGMLRSVVETLGRGCLTIFDGNYEPIKKNGRVTGYEALYKDKGLVHRDHKDFLRCTDNNDLCLSCRIFGMMRPKRGEGNSDRETGKSKNLFLGKVNIGDACAPQNSPLYKKAFYTADLMGPKPHHADFYLDATKKAIAGRKYYFHHATEPLQSSRVTGYNRDIQPLDKGTTFHARLDFARLTADEFAALLLAITLEDNMRHKIGYAKPLGLGSVHLIPQSMALIDYSNRYTQPDEHGQTHYDHEAIVQIRNTLLKDFNKTHLASQSLGDLRRIWRWPADPNVIYKYPDYDWFKDPKNHGKRLAQTP